MANVTINLDKTISIDGKKTFYIAMHNICAPYYPLVNCDNQIKTNNNALATMLAGDSTYSTPLKAKLIANNIMFWKLAFQSIEPTSPGLLAYWQPDEPTVGQNQYPIRPDMTMDQIKALMLSRYNEIKTKDPNHPVVLNHWISMTEWMPYADIMMWDTYAFRNNSWVDWIRADSIYAWEIQSWRAYFKGTELNTISKPVWTYIAALGKDDSGWGGLKLTPKEVRCNTYTAITLDVKGIEYFGYMVMGDWAHVDTITGVYSDQILASYYNQLMGEIRDLNDVLVSETLDYSWMHHNGKGMVQFSNKINKTVEGETVTNFNYILKPGYLIVVNKDIQSVTTNITVSGLSNTTIRTMGRETSGSGRTGRILTSSSNTFTDTFDGLAVHIYQISNNCPPSQCNFTITQ